jgi:hypothetical protein
MATTWLRAWLEGAGVHGLHPAPGEPLLRWLLVLHERAQIEERAACEGLDPHRAAMLDELRHEAIATQMHTLPQDARDAVRAGDILAVRAAETAALVWTLAAADVFVDPIDSITKWRQRLATTAAEAQGVAAFARSR